MARLDLRPGFVEVTLSRRNLLALLHKLDWPPSARTIVCGDCYRGGEPVDDVRLVLRCEDDTDHYNRRPQPPGEMHPETETWIDEHTPHRDDRGPAPEAPS